ncbi:MAG: polysaccharide deacetylase family protein [Deltaproteobacteria bacterium]|nr:polysaccharide deacetylase family protein [Deltaproteobacteria bacterium]
MKGWRMARAALRTIFHTALVLGPAAGLLLSQSLHWRLVFGAATLVGVALIIWAGFVYIPGFDPFFRVPWRGPRRGRRLAITFDDGPNGAFTEEVLELFRRHGGKATFFMVGQSVEREPELARRVLAEGHAVGSHTYSHQKLHRLSRAEMVSEVERGHACLEAAGINGSRLFRAPHGLKTFALVRHLTRRGIRLIGWTDGVYDTDCPSAEIIAARALKKLRPGEILLLHDGKQGHDRRPMVTALDTILAACRERRLEPVTVPELLDSAR